MSILEKISGIFKGEREIDKDTPILYTLSTCPKCKLIKQYMKKQKLPYQELDANGEGKERLRHYHMENFHTFAHGPKGCISFPIYVDEKNNLQGITSILAFLTSENRLDGFFSVGFLHFEWIDGIHISEGNQEYAEEFLAVLRFLKKNDFRLQVDTNGKNSNLLKKVLEEGLADSVIMNVVGPGSRYGQILGEEINLHEVQESMLLLPKFKEYKYRTEFLPHEHPDKTHEHVSYLTVQEIEETAKFITEVTGNTELPYYLKIYEDEQVDTVTLNAYLTAASKHQIHTKIETEFNSAS